jgi:hypothetical protein
MLHIHTTTKTMTYTAEFVQTTTPNWIWEDHTIFYDIVMKVQYEKESEIKICDIKLFQDVNDPDFVSGMIEKLQESIGKLLKINVKNGQCNLHNKNKINKIY